LGRYISVIYTIGYGNRKFEDFIRLLKDLGIEVVADVRAFPRSKWPEFTGESLRLSLPGEGIKYVHLEKLGGYRRGGYEAYTRTREFKEGLGELMKLAQKKKTVIMCRENYPSGCHRRFIARELKKLGWEVIHLVGKGARQKTL